MNIMHNVNPNFQNEDLMSACVAYQTINHMFDIYSTEFNESKSCVRLKKILNKYKKKLEKEHPWIECQ